MENRFTVHLEEDKNGDLILPFPDEMLESLGWQEGDMLEFVEDEYSDAFYIRKVDWTSRDRRLSVKAHCL